jgi:cytochrome c peroxidase
MRGTLHALALLGLAAGCAGQIGNDDAIDVAAQKTSTSLTTSDDSGQAMTWSQTPIDLTSANDFFHVFGTNGRTCGTCHKPDQGWSISAAATRALPASDPIFVLDGSDCLGPGQPNPSPSANSKSLLRAGLIRVEESIPANADFTLVQYSDPFNCAANPLQTRTLRLYRRPLPSANSFFLATIMWDGREPSLASQANDATLGHAQATKGLTGTQQNGIAAFESGTFFTQATIGGLRLDTNASGGAQYLMNVVAPSFTIGINDVFSPSFSPTVFTIYRKWENQRTNDTQAAIGRGEAIFNSRSFTIAGVRGLNAPTGPAPASFTGFCGSCHDTPNVGNHSVPLAIDVGVADPDAPGLDTSMLPRYTFRSGSQTITVTDPGRGIVTGKFADIGKFKGPVLRGLAARAPYFHNGAAPDLATVVDFYNTRFSIGLTAQEKSDLVAFLGAL